MCHSSLRTWCSLWKFLQGLSEDVISSLKDEVASNENENDHEFVEDGPEDKGAYNQSAEDDEGNEEQDI